MFVYHTPCVKQVGSEGWQEGQDEVAVWYRGQHEKTEPILLAFSWSSCLTKVGDPGQVISHLNFCFTVCEMRRQNLIVLNQELIDLVDEPNVAHYLFLSIKFYLNYPHCSLFICILSMAVLRLQNRLEWLQQRLAFNISNIYHMALNGNAC